MPEREFRSLDALPLGACAVDSAGRVLGWNLRLSAWTGVSVEEALGGDAEKLLGSLASPRLSERMRAVLEGGPPAVLSSRLHSSAAASRGCARRPAAPAAFKTTIARIPTEVGCSSIALVTIQDVTALVERVSAFRQMKNEALRDLELRRCSEERLRRKNELLMLLGRSAHSTETLEGVVRCVEGKFKGAHASVSAAEEGVVPDKAPVSPDDQRRHLALPLLSSNRELLGALQVSLDAQPHPSPEDVAMLEGMAKVACIAMERDEAERTRALLSSIVESTSDAIIGFSGEGSIETWNEASERLLGYTKDEVLGRGMELLLEGSYRSEFMDLVHWVMQGNTYSDLETEWRRKDGTEVSLSLTLSAIGSEAGSTLGAAVIARDITERKRHEAERLRYTEELEEQRERVEAQAQALLTKSELLERARDEALRASRIKADFLSTMSHEIRTPMNGIIGMTELLLETPLGEEQLDSVRTIQTSGENLLCIINDILDLSKLEAGKMTFEEAPFDLRRALADVIVMTRLKARSKGIELLLDWDPGLPCQFESDAVRITQVVMNLVSNAIKFTSEGRVEVLVGGQARADGRMDVTLEVHDTGIGIAPEHVEQVFSAFQQADSSTTRRFGGTGLGLTICKQICEGLGGDITVSSVEGQGSVFRVELPLRPVQAESEVPRTPGSELEARRTPESDATTFEAYVLLVEDNPINQKVACAALSQLGCSVEVAENGQEAVDLASEQRFDLILMDCQMPVMNGLDATRELRAKRLCDETPIIAMTANAMEGDRERCLEAGMDDYLAKPFKRADLREILGVHVAGRERGHGAA